MGAYTCEYGVVHKVCRCTTPHRIKCDVPQQHRPNPPVEYEPCYRLANGLIGKHEDHPEHFFWYTSSGGGHYLDHDPGPNTIERDVKKWVCPGT